MTSAEQHVQHMRSIQSFLLSCHSTCFFSSSPTTTPATLCGGIAGGGGGGNFGGSGPPQKNELDGWQHEYMTNWRHLQTRNETLQVEVVGSPPPASCHRPWCCFLKASFWAQWPSWQWPQNNCNNVRRKMHQATWNRRLNTAMLKQAYIHSQTETCEQPQPRYFIWRLHHHHRLVLKWIFFFLARWS